MTASGATPWVFEPPAWPRTLFVVRHGQSVWNRRKRITGQLDPPLSEIGHQQAAALADALRTVPLQAVYSSGLQRAIETARPTAERHGLTIRVDVRFDEINHGALQGRYRDASDPQARALWARRKINILEFRCPGGENLLDLACRVRPALEDLMGREGGNNVLIVGHRNTNRVVLGLVLGLAPQDWGTFNPRSRELYAIRPMDPTVRLQIHRLDRAGAGAFDVESAVRPTAAWIESDDTNR